jgi:hypothetical protein
VYRAIRVLIQCREALGASVGHGAHATLIIDPPPNLSGQPEKNRNPIAAVPSRSAHSHRNARDGELIDKRVYNAGRPGTSRRSIVTEWDTLPGVQTAPAG